MLDLDKLGSDDDPSEPNYEADLDALREPLVLQRWAWLLPWPTPPLTANRSNGPIGAAAKRKREAKTAENALLREFHPRGWDYVAIELVWFRPSSGRADPTNIAPTIKVVEDALVAAGVIPDDNAHHVHHAHQRIVLRREDPHPERGQRLLLVLYRLERPEYT